MDKFSNLFPCCCSCVVYLSSSVSDSGSSQGLSQPSTQTTQYLRADTPNNAASVTSKIFTFPSSIHVFTPQTRSLSQVGTSNLSEMVVFVPLFSQWQSTDLHAFPNAITDWERANEYHKTVVRCRVPALMMPSCLSLVTCYLLSSVCAHGEVNVQFAVYNQSFILDLTENDWL